MTTHQMTTYTDRSNWEVEITGAQSWEKIICRKRQSTWRSQTVETIGKDTNSRGT